MVSVDVRPDDDRSSLVAVAVQRMQDAMRVRGYWAGAFDDVYIP